MNQSSTFVGQHIFSQLLSLCSRDSLAGVFNSTKANYYYKSIKAWDHFVAMMFCTLGGCTSLREICMGLESFEGKLNHLGIEKAPARSTLSDANKNRSSGVFKAIYEYLSKIHKLDLSDSRLPKAVLQKLFIVDSTVFSLFKAILKTSGRNPTDGRRKGGIKKNTMLDAVTLMPVLVQFNAAADNDQQFLKFVTLPPQSYVTFDKGYNNYVQFAAFTTQNIYFITRQKENAVYTSIEEKQPEGTTPDEVLKDEIIEQPYTDENHLPQTLRLRRIAWWDATQNKCYEFITNNFDLEAKTIAEIYRYRWQIELFFKKLKQNFPLQYFVGDNQNAIEIQIWCALIALLLLQVVHLQNQSKIAFSNLVAVVRIQLFNYISLKKLLELYNRKRCRKPPSNNTPELFNYG